MRAGERGDAAPALGERSRRAEGPRAARPCSLCLWAPLRASAAGPSPGVPPSALAVQSAEDEPAGLHILCCLAVAECLLAGRRKERLPNERLPVFSLKERVVIPRGIGGKAPEGIKLHGLLAEVALLF